MLIYIHVPFCISRCTYCAFHSNSLQGESDASKKDLIDKYVEGLRAEISLYGNRIQQKDVQSVFFGGGTPSLLSAENFSKIMETLKTDFNLTKKAEITIEANPESIKDRKKLEDYLALGANRLSIGIQSLNDAALKMLGRPHRAIDSLKAISRAREAGFINVSVDLMWGLPGQSVHQWLQTLKEVTALGPEHISAYGLSVEPGTKMEELCEKGELATPPERDQSLMFMEGSATLETAGFMHYEISNFARMGYQCRHNLGYWEGRDYLGLGPSSTSTINEKRWTNPANLSSWLLAVNKGQVGQNAEMLSPRTRALELVMLRLRTARGLRLKSYQDYCGRDFVQDNKRIIQALHENGLAKIRNGYLALTRSGMLVSNSIISNLFENVQKTLGENPAQYNLKALNEPQSGEMISAKQENSTFLPVIWPEVYSK